MPDLQTALDVLLGESFTVSTSTDAFLKGTWNKACYLDAVLQGTLSLSCSADVYLVQAKYVETHVQTWPQVLINGQPFYFERGSYEHRHPPVSTIDYSVTNRMRRQVSEPAPEEWAMNVVCLSRDDLYTLSGQYIKTSSSNRKLPFMDAHGDHHDVYFVRMGEIETLDRKATLFKVPITLREAPDG